MKKHSRIITEILAGATVFAALSASAFAEVKVYVNGSEVSAENGSYECVSDIKSTIENALKDKIYINNCPQFNGNNNAGEDNDTEDNNTTEDKEDNIEDSVTEDNEDNTGDIIEDIFGGGNNGNSGSSDENVDNPTQQKPDSGISDNSLGLQVLELVNEQRRAAGLSALSWDNSLSAVAAAHSQDMADNGFFSHTNLKGLSPFDRMKNYGISYRTAAENIAAGQKTAQAVMDSWMNSSGHRANIMNGSFNKMGIGTAKGGSYGIYWTQCFTD